MSPISKSRVGDQAVMNEDNILPSGVDAVLHARFLEGGKLRTLLDAYTGEFRMREWFLHIQEFSVHSQQYVIV